MEEYGIFVNLTISNRQQVGPFEEPSKHTTNTVEFAVSDGEPWWMVMERLQKCVEAQYGYTFEGYGCNADDDN